MKDFTCKEKLFALISLLLPESSPQAESKNASEAATTPTPPTEFGKEKKQFIGNSFFNAMPTIVKKRERTPKGPFLRRRKY